MEILWPALGICAIVCVVFFALAQHWQQLLRRQSRIIQRLTERVRELEDLDDPDFRRRLGESAPVPLEQVYNFSFRLTDHFWKHTLCLSDQDLRFVQAHGSLVGSVKLERWRSHTVATVAEILPASKAVQWQTRSLDFYPDPSSGADSLNLWQLSLARPDGTALRPPTLELTLRGNYLEFAAQIIGIGNGIGSSDGTAANSGGNSASSDREETLLMRVPLDNAKLAEFRSHDPTNGAENGKGQPTGSERSSNGSGPGNWQAFYSYHDENLGLEWQLWVRDLSKKAEWERWKIVETTAIAIATDNEG
jgi:hypothetical protein